MTWTRDELVRFKKAYSTATKMELSEFTYNGHHFVTAYAKYLIEYLEGKFK